MDKIGSKGTVSSAAASAFGNAVLPGVPGSVVGTVKNGVSGFANARRDQALGEALQNPDRMIALIEGAERQKTPNEIALSILLSALTIIFLVVVMALKPFAAYAGVELSVTVLVALLVCFW